MIREKLKNRIISSIKWIIGVLTSLTFWAFFISCIIVPSVVYWGYYKFSDPQFLIANNFKDYVEIVRNILMGLVPLLGFPMIVWSTETANEQKKTAKKSLQETENNNRRNQENKIYTDCVTQLASDKETIRTASIHGFGELLENLNTQIKTLSDTDPNKQERINFQDKILNVLWSFMVEHSREVLKLKDKDDNSQAYKEAQEKINALYHPQFRFIMELLAQYRPHTYALSKFWQNKYWYNIYLQGINLNGVNLSYAYLRYANLEEADLEEANLSGVNLNIAHLNRANLSGANLSGADLIGADLIGVNLSHAKYCKHTQFPNGFDLTQRYMMNVDKEI